MDTILEPLVSILKNSNRIIIFTGAGISTESGISDYRSKGGLWQRFQPVTIQEFISSKEKRKEYWVTKRELYESFKTARPNAGHLAIVGLQRMGKLKGVITQNIDGLHQMAGIPEQKILELHGSNRETVCLSCQDITPWETVHKRLEEGDETPNCEKCGGFLKPNTISFGQPLDPSILNMAFQWGSDCDCLLALGSTLVVEPAASIPRLAKEKGAKLAIITLSETPLDDIADLKITSSIGELLSKAVNSLQPKTL